MVDIFSVLVHLGPTIIGGGDFYHRATVTVGPCIPVHRSVKVLTVWRRTVVLLNFVVLIFRSMWDQKSWNKSSLLPDRLL